LKYAFYPGCTLQSELFGCELSIRETLPRLGVELVDLDGASCCGYQTYNVSSPLVYKYLVARNLALAERLGLDIMTPCNGCHLAFVEVKRDLEKDPKIMSSINEALSKEGLQYDGKARAHHLLEVLHDEVTAEGISKKIKKPIPKVRLSSHLGCLGFRPNNLDRPDTGDISKLDDLIHALGAVTLDYNGKLECCGYIASLGNEEAAQTIANKKLQSVKALDPEGLVVICPLCFKMFDKTQGESKRTAEGEAINLPIIYYTQLLGLSMGLPSEKLGINFNQSNVEPFLSLFKG
jgi:heterodisulfide reductase subunit B